MKCFDVIHAIVFVVSLSSYNEMMFEDENKNQMLDSLELFEKTCNCYHLMDTPIFLLFCKTDVFHHKIKHIPITECPAFQDFDQIFMKHYKYRFNVFPLLCGTNEIIPLDIKNLILVFCGFRGYTGLELNYIKGKFEVLNQNLERPIVTHFINSFDQKQVEQWVKNVMNLYKLYLNSEVKRSLSCRL
eukprot:151173_1